jgi:hypothetical protein
MRFDSILILSIGLFISQFSFSAVCPSSSNSVNAGNGNCTVTGSQSTIQLNFNSGFDDATAISAAGGNVGASIGAQRKLSFIKAAEILADQIASTQTVIVDADFLPLFCTLSSATLGSAGPSSNYANAFPKPATAISNTFYPIGLINSLGDTDYLVGVSDIHSAFNSNIGNTGCLQGSNGWYYGFDAPPSNYIGFTTVLLHEMTHGLGFASLVNALTGAKAVGLDDVFSNNLYSKLDGSSWANAGGLSNEERSASAVSSNGLLWNGSNVNIQAQDLLTAGYDDADFSSSFTSGDRVQMYAPNAIESGSSVSHFDTAASPNEIMEPQYTAGQLELGLALPLLKDIGWVVAESIANTAPTITALDQSTNEDSIKVVDASSWGSDIDTDTLIYTVNSACATNITCSINTNGTGLSMIPAANHNGGIHTITLSISDGINSLVSDTFNLNVVAVNDAPVLTGIPNQSIIVGSFKDIVLSGYASDVDIDPLTFSATACGENLTCTFPNATTMRVTANSGGGSIASVTVAVDDSNGGANIDSFDVSIIALAIVNVLPTISALDQSTNEDSIKVVDASSWGIDIDTDTLIYSVNSACATNITCSINTNGTGLSMIPAANHNGAIHTITLSISDGINTLVSDTFNLNVVAVNDAPVLTGIPNQSIIVGSFRDIVLSGYASDVDIDPLTFSATACGEKLTCTFPNATTMRITANSGGGTIESVTVAVDDSSGGTNTDSFDVSITAAAIVNALPTISALDQSTNEDSIKVVDASSWGSDIDNDTLIYSVNSACATNITCSINTNGTGLSMIPAANHNGGIHTITLSISDGINSLVSDTFNLNVVAQNDAPVLTGIPNQSIIVGAFKDIVLSGYASDVDIDPLTFSATACGENLTCTFPNSTTMRITANSGGGTIESVTVAVDDSSGGTNTDSFDVSITATVPSTTVEVTGSVLNDGDTFTLLDSSTQINVNNGSTHYSYELSYNSFDVGNLISSNSSGLTIEFPTSGEFAGEYLLTIIDDTDGDVITITVMRPLRLNWSTKALLNDDTTQTLKIEGGAAGTVYNLVQSGNDALVFRDDIENSIIAATAEDDAESYNAALISLDSITVASIANMDVTVQSTYDDVIEVGVQVYPSSLHQFTVINTSDVAVDNAVATLNGGEILLTELNVLMSYDVDVNGDFTVLLPNTHVLAAGSNYGIQISALGYNSNTLSLNSDNIVHNVVLVEIVTGIVLMGDITAQGNQNFLQEAPVVTIIYSDDMSEVIPVFVDTSTRANFNYEVDLNLKSLSALIISQENSEVIELDIANINQSQSFDVLLLNNTSIVISQPLAKKKSGGGSLIWFNVYVLCMLFFRSLLLKRKKIRHVLK